MVGFTVSVTISALSQSWFCATVKVRFSCLWPLVLQNRCTDMETGGFNWLWSCCGCCLTGMCTCEESEKNWWEMLFTFIYLLMIFKYIFYLNIDAAFLTQNWELEKIILNANCIKVFPLLFLQKKILVYFQDLHRQVRNNK